MSDDNASLGLALLGLATRGTFVAGFDGITYPTAPASPPPPPPPAQAPSPASWRESVDAAVAKASLAFKDPPSESEQLDKAAGLAPETAADVLARARAIGERAAKTLREAQAYKQTAKAEKAARKAAKKGKK